MVTANNGKADVTMTSFSDKPIKSRSNVSIARAETITDTMVNSVANEISANQPLHKLKITAHGLMIQINQMKFSEKLGVNHRDELVHLFTKYEEIFPHEQREIGNCTQVRQELDAVDHPPVKRMPRRASYAPRLINIEHVQEMLDKGIIRPVTSSQSFPVVLVKKKDPKEKPRFCVNLVNQIN